MSSPALPEMPGLGIETARGVISPVQSLLFRLGLSIHLCSLGLPSTHYWRWGEEEVEGVALTTATPKPPSLGRFLPYALLTRSPPAR